GTGGGGTATGGGGGSGTGGGLATGGGAATGGGSATDGGPPDLFLPPVIIPTLRPDGGSLAPTGITAGDVDGDGLLDLVVTGVTVSVLFGDGDGGFSQTVNVSTAVAARSVLADVDGDGTTDIVTSQSNVNSAGLATLLNRGNRSFAVVRSTGVVAMQSLFVDGPATAGGLPLLVEEDGASDRVFVGTLAADGGFLSQLGVAPGNQPFTLPPSRTFVTARDFTGDGVLDLVVGSPRGGEGTVDWYARTPPNTFTLVQSSQTLISPIGSAWLGPDVVVHGGLGVTAAHRLDGGVPSFNVPLRSEFVSALEVGDVTGDGRPDVVVTRRPNTLPGGAVLVLSDARQPGDFEIVSTSPNTGDGPTVVVLADLNRDARLDVVVGASIGRSLRIYLQR
ncbi:MAG: FG-GAP repeat domain-containing protein, partial [Myxococcota bacterium]